MIYCVVKRIGSVIDYRLRWNECEIAGIVMFFVDYMCFIGDWV